MDADSGVVTGSAGASGAPGTAEIGERSVEANGLRFHVATCGGGDRLALLLHGFPQSSLCWRHQLSCLARLGYRVWAPDLRGYGRSERPARLADYAIEALMDDVAGLIDAAVADGVERVLLVGHDWGAIIAWYFAMRKLRALEGLAILNVPHPAVMEGVLRRSREQRKRSWYGVFFQLPGAPEWMLGGRRGRRLARALERTSAPGAFPPEVLAAYADAVSQPGAARAMVNYYRALVRGGGGRRQRELGYPVIETPTLMIWGEDDVALSIENTVGTERYVSDLTLRRLPGVSHWVQEEAPEVVNAMLEAWLSGREVPEAGALDGGRG